MTSEEGVFYNNQVLIGPGSRLRMGREACRLSQEEVARRLRLRVELISALENDDFSTMPAFVFIRGYLRAYANLVNLNSQEIIEAFNNLKLQESPTVIPPSTRSFVFVDKHQIFLKDNLYRNVSYIAALLLVTLVLVWWYVQKNSSPVPSSSTSTTLTMQPSTTQEQTTMPTDSNFMNKIENISPDPRLLTPSIPETKSNEGINNEAANDIKNSNSSMQSSPKEKKASSSKSNEPPFDESEGDDFE